MGFKKESDKYVMMKKKKSPFKKQNSTEEKQEPSNKKNKSSSDISNAINKNIEDNARKGLKSYREELSSDDYGVESGSKMLETASEQSYKNVKSLVKKSKEKKESLKQKKNESQEENDISSKLKKPDEKRGSEKLTKKDDKQLQNAAKNLNKKYGKKKKTPKGDKKFVKKIIQQPKKLGGSTKDKGIQTYKEALESDNEGMEVGTKGTKLVKDIYKKTAHVNKVRNKKKSANKLKGQSTKLTSSEEKGMRFSSKLDQKAYRKKKIKRKSIDKLRKKNAVSKPLLNLTNKSGAAISNKISFAKKALVSMIRKLLRTKAIAAIGSALGSLFTSIAPVAAVMGVIIGIIMIVMAMAGGGGGEEEIEKKKEMGEADVSSEVEEWRDTVTKIAKEEEMEDYVDLVLAIIQIETGGTGTKDIMQSSESAGHPPEYFKSETKSIKQGVSYLKDVVEALDEKHEDDEKLIAQTYNYGLAFAGYMNKSDSDGYDIDISAKYSKNVVAKSLGNTTGATYPYKNEISKKHDKQYLYKNGGNFYYGEEVAGYIENEDGSSNNSGGSSGDWNSPVNKPIITSPYGNRNDPFGGGGDDFHKGLDFDCVGGSTPIKAVEDGEVVYAQFNDGGFGNTVMIKHGDINSHYAHMNTLKVKKGDKVKQGDEVGVCGSTGDSTGPHLHFEAKKPKENLFDGQMNPDEMLGEIK